LSIGIEVGIGIGIEIGIGLNEQCVILMFVQDDFYCAQWATVGVASILRFAPCHLPLAPCRVVNIYWLRLIWKRTNK